MRPRQKMHIFDWFNWAALAAIGVFLGLAVDSMFDLAVSGAWGSILMILALSAGGIVFYLLIEKVFTFISIGRFSEPRQLQKRRKPLMLLFALPIGVVVGVIGAQFGLGDLLLEVVWQSYRLPNVALRPVHFLLDPPGGIANTAYDGSWPPKMRLG